jgi:hypothetical protein
MMDEQTLAQINGECNRLPDEHPVWSEMLVTDFDRKIVDQMLSLTPEQRLAEHQYALDFIFKIEAAGLDPHEVKQRFKGSNLFLKI